MVPLIFCFAQFSPRHSVGNENVSQMYSSPIFIVERRCIIFLYGSLKTTKLMKEFLTAQMYMDAFPTMTEDVETFNKNMEIWSSKVKPFFEHFEEVLNSL